MVNVVLAVGEGFACEGVFGMTEHRFKRLFNLLPRDAFEESQSSESI